jgi:hypothetical protein
VESPLQLNKLVTDHWVDGWDDPRLMTLAGLRRRGASSEAINSFCRALGITRRWGIYSRKFSCFLRLGARLDSFSVANEVLKSIVWTVPRRLHVVEMQVESAIDSIASTFRRAVRGGTLLVHRLL